MTSPDQWTQTCRGEWGIKIGTIEVFTIQNDIDIYLMIPYLNNTDTACLHEFNFCLPDPADYLLINSASPATRYFFLSLMII